MITELQKLLSEPLETVCPDCGGRGKSFDYEESVYDSCETCNGGGFVPTELGKPILELMRHNARLLRTEMSEA